MLFILYAQGKKIYIFLICMQKCSVIQMLKFNLNENSKKQRNNSIQLEQYLKMNNHTKFSISNVTIDTDNNRLHDCPACRCPSPKNRPVSPQIKNMPPSPNLYLSKGGEFRHQSNSWAKNMSPMRLVESPKHSMRPVSPNTKITIRYTSPERQRRSELYSPTYAKPSPLKHNSPGNTPPLPRPHQAELQHQPKKPSILNRHANKGMINKPPQPPKKKQPVSTTNNYYRESQDEQQIAETIIKELNLNYDYFSINDISDISADVSL